MQWWLKSSRGVVVVLVVVSLCVPQGRAMYTFSCDGQFLTLQCPAGALHIRSAMFGRNANGQFRCGESSRIYRPCETDITEFMRYKCQGQTFCRVHVELATFNLETFCPEFIKYAEVHFDCLPRAALHRAHACRANCMPAPSPAFRYNGMQAMGAHSAHMTGGGLGVYGASNAVLQGPQVTGPSGQPGVIYSHHGGVPVHVPASGATGAGQQSPKGFGSPPMEPLPGIPEPSVPQPSPPQGSNPQGASVLQAIRSHGTGATNSATASGQGQSGSPSTSASHDALIAKIGQMIGAARRGHVG